MYSAYAKIRDEREMTDYAVAKALGFSPSTLSDWKNGIYKPKVDKLLKISQLFGVPLEYFLTGDESNE